MAVESFFYRINRKVNTVEELNILDKNAINKSEQIDFDIVNTYNKFGKEEVLNKFFKDELITDNDMLFLDFRISLAIENVNKFKEEYQLELKNKNHYPIIKELIGNIFSHGDLQKYIKSLCNIKNISHDLNNYNFILTKEDLSTLLVISELAINGEYKPLKDFEYWGNSTINNWKDTKKIVKNILETTDFEKETIYYMSWW